MQDTESKTIPSEPKKSSTSVIISIIGIFLFALLAFILTDFFKSQKAANVVMENRYYSSVLKQKLEDSSEHYFEYSTTGRGLYGESVSNDDYKFLCNSTSYISELALGKATCGSGSGRWCHLLKNGNVNYNIVWNDQSTQNACKFTAQADGYMNGYSVREIFSGYVEEFTKNSNGTIFVSRIRESY